jgi:hypothetical protein
MTDYAKTALCTAFAATLLLATVPTAVTAKSLKGPKGLTTGTQGQSAGRNNTFCGNGDIFVIYDEDKNGNRIPGTERYGCTD